MAQFKNTDINDSGSLTLPAGTTAQRPSNPQAGMMRYNTTLDYTEYYNGSAWVNISSTYPEARGGIVVETDIGGIPYRIHKFLVGGFPYVSQAAASSATPSGTGTADVLGESDPCSGLVTFREALEYAHSRNCRLPTRAEILAGVTVGSGCGYDNELIWTCDKVDDAATQHYVMFGRVATNGTATTPRDNNDQAYVRFVADVDINRSDPNIIDDPVIADFYRQTYPGFLEDRTTSADFTVTKGGEVEYLIVGGGGGGGSDNAGGGGAGGLLTGFTTVSPQTYTITIGGRGQGANGASGGTARGATNGGNSSAFGLTAIGGGRGASGGSSGQVAGTQNPATGGSGGGGDGEAQKAGAAGTAGQGNAGGNGDTTGDGGGGGGGGAGGAGQNGGGFLARQGGNGGPGIASNITGELVGYAGGGGGGSGNNFGVHGRGGFGGGGDGSYQIADLVEQDRQNGQPNTGGGGGGGAYDNVAGSPGGYGGNGIVVIRYPKDPSTTLPVNDTQISTVPKAFVAEPYRHFYNIRTTTTGIDYYYLHTPGDLESRTLVSNFEPLTVKGPGSYGGLTRIDNLALSNDGKQLYVCGTNRVMNYRLTRPFDPASAEFMWVLTSFHSATEPTCFHFADQGRKFYDHQGSNGEIIQYDLTTPYDIRTRTNGTATLTGLGFPNWGPGNPAFSPDGTRVAIGARSRAFIVAGQCTTPFDLSTFVQETTFTPPDTDPSSCIWNRDGTTLYVRHASPDMINEISTPNPYTLVGASFVKRVMPNTAFAAGGIHINTDF